MPRMEPLTIELLNEGDFSQELNREFKDLQKQHLNFLKKHGDNAKDSKSKITVQIELQCQDPKTEFFSIKTEIKKAIPVPPPRITTGVGDMTQTDELALFVRKTGSSHDTPKQHTIEEELEKKA